MRVRPLFAWYDVWIGLFYDREKRRLFILPVPCLGIVVEFGRRQNVAPDCVCKRENCTYDPDFGCGFDRDRWQ
jgi:hypothetical protein